MGRIKQHTGEKPDDILEIRIYRGASGQYELYEDEGDNYDYEKGSYSTILFTWDDLENKFIVGDRSGSFPGMPAEREFNIVLVSKNKGTGIKVADSFDEVISYSGNKVSIKL